MKNSVSLILSLGLLVNVGSSDGAVGQYNPIAEVRVVEGSIAEDPVNLAGNSTLRGTLSYDFLKNYSQKEDAIAVRKINVERVATTTYILKLKQLLNKGVFDSQVSIDGNSIVFKYGYSFGDNSSYDLYWLSNARSKKPSVLKINGNSELSFGKYYVSPNGRYIAFVVGGDVRGKAGQAGGVNTYIFDAYSKAKYLLPDNNCLPNSIIWSNSNVLYFSSRASGRKNSLPDLYSFNPTAKKRRLAFKNCYKPVISPDEKKVAFFGSQDPSHPLPLGPDWEEWTNSLSLCTANIDGSSRAPLNLERGAYPVIVWSRTGQACYSLKEVQPSPHAQLSITKWDLKSRQREEILRLPAQDIEFTPRDEFSPQFSLVGTSDSRDALLVLTSENLGDDTSTKGTVKMKARQQIHFLDLKSKTSSVVVKTSKALSYHWKGN